MSKFTAVIERDPETGFFIATIPALPGAHTQAESLDELSANLKEVLKLVLEEIDEETRKLLPEFIGIQQIEVSI